MPKYDWYRMVNKDDFESTGLVSRTLTVDLDGIGLKSILITKGNLLGITYEGVFLPVNLNGVNPFYFEGYGVYLRENGDVFLGIMQDED